MFKKSRRQMTALLIMFGAATLTCQVPISVVDSVLVKQCEFTGGRWIVTNSDTNEGFCDYQDPQEDVDEDGFPYDESGPDPEANPIDEFPSDEGDTVAPSQVDDLPDDQPSSESTVSEWTVRLIPIDVRTIDTPPEIIAYANVDHATPPDNVSIESQGELWTYNANIALLEMGDWISATCTNQDVTAVGVRLEGDGNDGWVRVMVDGREVWRGSIYGDQNSAEGMFLNYLEVSGLEPGTHTIRLENLGIAGAGGGIHVAMRFFGFSTRPISVSIP